MSASAVSCPGIRRGLLILALPILSHWDWAHSCFGATAAPTATLIATNGSVLWSRPPEAENPAFVPLPLSVGDRVRTLEASMAVVRLADRTEIKLRELSVLHLLPPASAESNPLLGLVRGALYFFGRDRPDRFRIRTPHLTGAVRGTEFQVLVEELRTAVLLVEGEMELENKFGRVVLQKGEAGVAEDGRAPQKIAIEAVNVVQWWLYYPAVLDPAELNFGGPDDPQLKQSLAAYRIGDLRQALTLYPKERLPKSDDERVYYGGLLLTVGEVAKARQQLSAVPAENQSRQALEALIAAVTLRPAATPGENASASQMLAASYLYQSQHKLTKALDAARAALQKSPLFGFAWHRLAELEFSFGRTARAQAAVQRSLDLTPRNAQAHALSGFLQAARNQIERALQEFDVAIAMDNRLGNAWLGRGLSRIRRGDGEAGRKDLQTAAVLEPNRSLLRAYLGKAFADNRDYPAAVKELEMAEELDRRDPTPSLYSALLRNDQNRINEAVTDLENSQELNDNRAVYRSRLLLDQDRAARGANLASIYRDAGMLEVSAREAARAVNVDYGNYSAHLFLANSYGELLNYSPQVNLRYETPRVSEYLLATLLAPVGAGVLSPTVSQQEYSRFFERDRFGLVSSTEYLSRGAWAESAAQHGTFRDFSYSLDGYYQWDPGQRDNNDLELKSFSARVKQQLSPDDSVFLQAVYSDGRFGDLAQYYDPSDRTNGANRLVRSKETQEPLALAGYHHQWAPGSHTLFLAGRLQDTLRVENPIQSTLVLQREPISAPPTSALPFVVEQDYRSELEVYSAEVQQIFQHDPYALILGGRYQAGSFDTRNANTIIPDYVNAAGGILPPTAFDAPLQDFESDFERLNFYSYAHWQMLPPLRLIGGVAYDRLTYPVNFRFAPISGDEDTVDKLSPKAGFILTPSTGTVFRGAYSRALGGASIDQSFQLEPSQVAGFNQSWRSIIPESIAGANSAEQFETWGISLEHRFPTRTYLGISGEWLKSSVDRIVGVFDRGPFPFNVFPAPPFIFQSGTRQELDFDERTVAITFNQLIAEEWAFGARYRLSNAELDQRFPDIPASTVTYGGFRPRQELEASLHQVDLSALFNHSSGVFWQFDSLWTAQSSTGYTPDLSSEDFWQFNFFLGYRLARRQIEARVGVLNLTDRDYRINPLSLASELPRERTLVASFRFWF